MSRRRNNEYRMGIASIRKDRREKSGRTIVFVFVFIVFLFLFSFLVQNKVNQSDGFASLNMSLEM